MYPILEGGCRAGERTKSISLSLASEVTLREGAYKIFYISSIICYMFVCKVDQ